MTKFYQVKIIDKQREYHLKLPEDQYILRSAELDQCGDILPFSCRNGACTACAVKILEGDVYQPESMGLSPELKKKGYALLCVSYPRSDLVLVIQEPDEVYELQFGRYFARGKVRFGLPLDEE